MDTRFLITLLSVVNTGSFAASARHLGLTPAAVSQRVRVLERQLGTPLIVRQGHQVGATPGCLAILPRLKSIADAVRNLACDLDPTGLTGPIRLGAISTALGDIIPQVLSRFADEAPNASLAIVPGTSRNLYESLTKGEIDAAFLIQPTFDLPKALDCILIQHQTFVLITQFRDDRPIEQIMASSAALIYDTASWGGRIARDWLKNHVPANKVLCELDALEAIAAAVDRGIGYSVVPSWPGLSEIGQLRQEPIPAITATRDLVLLHRKLGHDAVRLLAPECS